MVSIGERLREERQRLGLSQTAFGDVGGVTKKTQMLYEGGERSPDATYFSGIAGVGADVQYIVTGQRRGDGIGESAVHQAILAAIDLLSLEKKVDADQLARAVIKLVQKIAPASGVPAAGSSQIGQQIGVNLGQVTKAGDINVGSKRKK